LSHIYIGIWEDRMIDWTKYKEKKTEIIFPSYLNSEGYHWNFHKNTSIT
jgi:hypothetical protein